MLKFLDGDGRMAQAIQDRDWSESPLGPPADWPASLKTTVSIVLNSHFPQCIVWGREFVTIPNDAFLPILGSKPPALGRPFSAVWAEAWESLAPIVDKAFAGEATFIEDFPLTIERHGHPELAYFTFCYSPIRDELGQIVGMLDTVTETTAKVEVHERQKVLAGELGHRLKNLLAVVQSVGSQTLRQAPDLATAQEALSFRLAAFGRAADVLTASEWDDADLHDLVRSAMLPHAGAARRLIVEGPPLRLRSEVALAMTLVLHELITNATKYGALSVDGGHVELRWRIEGAGDAEQLHLCWRELGGPAVQEPTRRGFGSVMIERSLRGYLRGDVGVDYRPEGLVFSIDAPLAGARAEGAAA